MRDKDGINLLNIVINSTDITMIDFFKFGPLRFILTLVVVKQGPAYNHFIAGVNFGRPKCSTEGSKPLLLITVVRQVN